MDCDRISELPDCLLTHIFSYLSTKDSVKTSILSKRWEFLWLKVSKLDLNAIDVHPHGQTLVSSVNRFLEFDRGLCLQKFKLKYQSSAFSFNGRKRVMEWIAEVVHRGVQHLMLKTN
ncbi:hypothetical protein EUTSA_v10001114mg [Eutrema salsugineum]|uniref:F-box domain-containing protein n=1 Tax=Eutrema salsugineum TaxID=72664 RepID=V4LB50_EUTSA|nr:hypothetical protein EUTSA_v10001114mg [Eutrema salsugineum]